MTTALHPGSFRDPSGFIFMRDGVLYRQVNACYADDYRLLMESGLYRALTDEGLLIAHREASRELALTGDAVTVICPERVPFISYPFEWCFSQLRDAALLTLRIQQRALAHGMSLKDATAYNIQFHAGKPVFIDTLSFERAQAGAPWVAYRQFCQHFLAPLALMAHTDIRLNQLLRIHLDGVPLDMAATLLPFRTRFNGGLLLHVHLHAKFQQKYADTRAGAPQVRRESVQVAQEGILDSLAGTIRGLTWEPAGTEWGDYYTDTNYSAAAFAHKEALVQAYIERIGPRQMWDLGANDGHFSQLAAAQGIPTVAFDVDPAAVEKCYRDVRRRGDTAMLPLLQDLTNPSPAIGWDLAERDSLASRGPADLVMALALIHHLAISNNVPLAAIAKFLHGLGRALIIEFVPKHDSQVQRLLATREDIFPHYTQEEFEHQFAAYFTLTEHARVGDSARTLYLMTGK